MSQESSSRSSSSSLSPAPQRNNLVEPLPPLPSDPQQRDNKEEKKSEQFSAPAVFTFAIPFSELAEAAEHLEDKEAIRHVLAGIKKGVTAIEKFFSIRNKSLYYPEIQQRLENIHRLLDKIPATPGLHYSIRDSIQKAIAPLQKEIHDFLLQEEGAADHQLLAKTQALYAQQAWIMRDETVAKALNQTLQAIAKVVPEGLAGQRCFISYAWPTPGNQAKEHWLQPFLRVLHGHLRQAGIKPVLDIVDNQAGANIVTFTDQIKNNEFAVLICTDSLADKHHDPKFKVVQTELSLLRQKYDKDLASGQTRVFPLLVSGSHISATLPEHHLYRTVRDWRVQSYCKNLEQLIGWICYPQDAPAAYQKIWQDFYAQYPALASPMPDAHAQQELSLHWHRREMDKLASEGFYQGLQHQQYPSASSFSSHVEEVKDTQETTRLPHTPATINCEMPKPVEGFIGRIELLNTLAIQFGTLKVSSEKETKETKEPQKSSSFLAASPRKLVLCTGLGGVGKTQLALQYAHTATPHYQFQFWFAADHPDTLNAGYRLFAQAKNLIGESYVPDKDIIKAVSQWFATHSNWLIIYDNVERYQEIAPYLPTQGAGDILLTSRSAPTQWPKSVTPVPVDVLPLAEAKQLIASLIDTPDDVNIPKLATLLGCLPLALVQACAYIRENSIPVAAYLKAYKARAKHLLQQLAVPAGFPRHDPVFVTWDISLDAIANEEKAKGKQVSAKQLLQYCAFLGPQKIPSRVLETWHTQIYPAAQEFMTEARSRLHAYSLIQLDTTDQSVQVHRLVQQVMRERLSAEEQAAQLQQTIALLTDAYPQESVGVGKAWDAIRFGFIPHLEAVIAYHAQYKLKEDTTLSLALSLLAAAYGDLGQVGKKRELLERALAIDEAHYGKAHYQVAVTLHNLGTAYGDLGQVGKKQALLERALAIDEAHYGKDHYQVAITLNNLGNAYGELGQVGKQRALLERALKIKEAHYGKEHYQVASTLTNLGNAYGDLGQVGKARDVLERALAIKEAHYGKEHYQVAFPLENLGNAYGALGQVGKKRELLERALAIQEAHYGRDHYQVASTLTNLGNAYGDLGRVGKKRELLERALAIKEAHYGRDHYQVASTLTNLGNAYGDLGQVGKKRELLERALAIFEAHYGKEHYQVAFPLENLGNAYGDLGQVGKARDVLERALAIKEAHYGKEHYQVAFPLENLGNAYGALGQVGKKRELLERALAIFEAHYGKEHPELAITLTNLAVAYQALKQPQAALQTAQRVYRNLMTHSDYGADHPKTIQCLQYLQSQCGFTVAMLQSGNAILEEKESTKPSLPITSPPPRESQVADKTPASIFPIDHHADQFDRTIDFQLSYDSTVHHYFSDLAGRTGNDSQGRALITLPDSISSASTMFTVSLSTVWLRQLQQNHLEDFHHLCRQLGVRENEMLVKIGLTNPSKQEYKENKSSEAHNMPLIQPPQPSGSFPLVSAESISFSTSTPVVPSNRFNSSLASHNSATLFSSTARQSRGSRPSSAPVIPGGGDSKATLRPKASGINSLWHNPLAHAEEENHTILTSNSKSPKPKSPGGTLDE